MSRFILVYMLSATLLTSHVVKCATSDESIDDKDHQLSVSHDSSFMSKLLMDTESESEDGSAVPKLDRQKSSYVINKETRATSLVLDWFVARLRSFMNDEIFDNERFENLRAPLGEDLDAIRKRINEIPFNAYLKDQLIFATYFYREMEECDNTVNFYRFNQVGQHMVRWVVTLNLTILTLFKPCGYPDSAAPGYSDVIERSRRLLMFWKSIYSEMEDVSLSIVILFERKSTQAENLLEHLESAQDDEEMR
ncbi:hypothetical protein OXX69_004656 [Metschnikowia pulcherrima]